MSDPNLFMFGCIVTFIVVGGIYVFAQRRYLEPEMKAAPIPKEGQRSA